MLIKLIENESKNECIINTDCITTMRAEGPQTTTTVFLNDGRWIDVTSSIADIVTIIEKGGNIYDTEGEA